MPEGTGFRWFHRWAVFFGILCCLMIAAMFVFSAVQSARHKDFWCDENFGLEGGARSSTYQQLLLRGVRGQGSAAPLDYILVKAWDHVYPGFSALVSHNVYYRLNSIVWDCAAGLIIALISFYVICQRPGGRRMLLLQSGLICLGLFVFYFKKSHMHFATEMRPYALWNSAWYVMLGCFMLQGARGAVFWGGMVLALTSSGALLQIPALALSRIIFRFVDRDDIRGVLREALAVFALPFLIAVYYAVQSDKFGYVNTAGDYARYSAEFYSFWGSKWRVPFLSMAGIVLTVWNRQWRGCTTVFFAILMLYACAPLINSRILSSGFFFTSRQYLYYDLVFPLFYLMLALILPGYWMRISQYRLITNSGFYFVKKNPQ